MEKPSVPKWTKLVIDIILGLLYILLLGYAFTGGQFHEAAGMVFAVIAVLHNVVNIGWYRALGKGAYPRKRTLVTVLDLALVVDVAAIVVSGVLNARYLFHTGVSTAWMGEVHSTLALTGLVLILSHVMVHGLRHAKKRHRRLPVVLTLLAIMLAVALKLWALPYLERHFLTVEIHRETVIAGETVDFDGSNILTVYFTRVGNTDFEDDVNAVSGASLLLDENQTLMGNSQVIALMIQNAAGGDIVPIHTQRKYPSSYFDTTVAAGQERKDQNLPQLVHMPDNLDTYDTVFLVYPLWWYTIPKPVEAFLKSYDFSGKTVALVVTHGGSGAGSSVEDVQAVCNGTVLDDPLEIYCGDVPDCRARVTQWLKEIRALGQ